MPGMPQPGRPPDQPPAQQGPHTYGQTQPQIRQFDRQAPQVQGNIDREAMSDDIAQKIKARSNDQFAAGIRNQSERAGDRSRSASCGSSRPARPTP